MRKNVFLMVFVLTAGVLLGACTPGAATQAPRMEPEPTEAMMEVTSTTEMMEEKPTDSMMESAGTEVMEETPAPEMMDETGSPEMMEEMPTEAMMDKTPVPVTGGETPQAGMMDDKTEMMSPAWFATELTDSATGQTFKIEDFKEKVVLVETFAQWCTTCLQQQREVVKLHEMMAMPDDVVTVSIDVDPNEDSAMLQTYLEKHGFDWRFAIAPTEMVREIGDLYGAQFLNPTSAPMLIIDRLGEVHPLPFGIKSAEDLQKALEPFISDSM